MSSHKNKTNKNYSFCKAKLWIILIHCVYRLNVSTMELKEETVPVFFPVKEMTKCLLDEPVRETEKMGVVVIQSLLDDLLTSVVSLIVVETSVLSHSDSSLDPVHDLDGSFFSLPSPKHPLPNSTDFWLLNRIKSQQPEYISPDMMEVC